MRECPPFHFAPDEFDAWLEGRLGPDRASHLETCLSCLETARAEREVVDLLERLPALSPTPEFGNRVMAAIGLSHLSEQEVEAWLSGALAPIRESHLAACVQCREFAESEAALVARLKALPLFAPVLGFDSRVMAQVALPEPAWSRSIHAVKSRIFASPRSLAIAAGLGTLVVGSMGASVAWSLTHQETISSIGSWLTIQAGQWFWVGLQGAVSNLMEQPWYTEIRNVFATPGRVAAWSALASALYVGGVVALRRLLVAPEPRIAYARI